jgi:hypothetical protein
MKHKKERKRDKKDSTNREKKVRSDSKRVRSEKIRRNKRCFLSRGRKDISVLEGSQNSFATPCLPQGVAKECRTSVKT